jgi:hypothetical protein
MATPYLMFLPGEFICCQSKCGTSFIGRIVSVSEANVTVSCWAIDNVGHAIETYNLPLVICNEHIIDTIPRPSLSSLVFVHHADDFMSFKKKFVNGMEDVFCTRDDVNLWLPAQSLSVILYESITSLVGELQRVLNDHREHQGILSSFSQYISILMWQLPKLN